jgi:hypothetical protein
VLVTALTVAAFAVRLLRLVESPEPPGTDGYYYVVQVQHWLTEGRFHVRDASWVLRWLGLGAGALGEPVLGIKVASALLAAACVPAAWAVGKGMKRGPLLLAAWAAASPTVLHLAGDFPKTLGAVPFLLAVLAWSLLGWRRPTGIAVGLGAVLLAATAHRLGASLLALGAMGALLGLLLRGRREAPDRRWPLAAVGVGALVLFAALTTVLPNLLHPSDLERVSSQLDLSPGVPPPFAYFSLRRTHPLQQAELGACWLGLAAGAVLLWHRRELRPLVMGLLLPLAVCLFPLWRGDVLDLGFRTSLLAPLLAVPLLVLAVPERLAVLPGPRAAALVALALVPLSWWGFDPRATPPYARYRALIARIPRPLPELLITHQGMNFLYDHETGHEAMSWAPEPELDRTRVGRLVWGVRDGEWLAYAPPGEGLPAPVRLDHDYVYVREDVFEAFLARAREAEDDTLTERLADWRNPSAVRPASLLRNREAGAN